MFRGDLMKCVLTSAWALMILFALPAAFAHAQGDDATATAKRYFESGKVLYKQGSYKEAVVEFQKAYSLFPNGALLFNIAKSYEKLGDAPQALRSYKEYLRAVPSADDKDDVQASINSLEKRLREKGIQQVRVYSTPPGAQVAINSEVKGNTPFSAEMAPGRYYLTLTKQGFRPVEKDFVVKGSTSLDLDFTLDEVKLAGQFPAPGEADQTGQKPPTTAATKELKSDDGRVLRTWIMEGVGVAAVITGGVLHYLAVSDYDTWKGLPETDPNNAGIKDSASTKLTAAFVMYGVGAAAVVGGVVWYLVGGESKASAKLAAQVSIVPGFAGMPGLALDGRW